jgi:hypothetical protein
MTGTHTRNIGVAVTALLASSATLVCCVLPAVLVSIGAGAVLVGLVAAVPQLVWLSEHKALVFGIAAGFLLARRLPCPTDPTAARTCATLRRTSAWVYGIAAIAYLLGVTFAFVLPVLM